MISHRKIEGPTEEPLELDEAKLHLRVSGDDENDLITGLIVAAREKAEAKMRRAIMPQKWKLSLSRFPVSTYMIELPRPTVLAVDKIEYVDSEGNRITHPADQYRLFEDSIHSYVMPIYNFAWPLARFEQGSVEITYSCGFADAASVPEQIKLWMKHYIGTHYEHRDGLCDKKELPRDYMDGLLDNFVVPVI